MQGLPERAIHHPTKTQACKHAGNAVAIPLVRELVRPLRIPTQAGQRFRRNLDTDSDASWTLIPTEAGQPKVIT